MSESAESVRLEIRGAVAEVVLCRPKKGNAMGSAFWRELPEVVQRADADPAVRVLLLRSEGDNFSFGLDLVGLGVELGPLLFGENTAAPRTQLRKLIERWQQAIDTIALADKPVVAAVQGWCIGGGVDLVSACDVRVCSAGAKFSVRETKMAIVADVGSLQRLPHIIGHAATAELALTGGDVDSARAERLGLVSRVYGDDEELLAGARELAEQIAGNPPLVVQGVKRVLGQAIRPQVQAGMDYVAAWNSAFLQSEDLTEALGAFAEKRPPTWTGR